MPTNTKKETQKFSWALRVLDKVEAIGNRLPHPATLFAILAALVAGFSGIGAWLEWRATHPTSGEEIKVFNLLGRSGLQWMFVNVTRNLLEFPPFGVVLVAMFGIGVAERAGLIEALIKQTVLRAPRKAVTAAVVTAGILSHLAASAGYVVLIPLGAMVFLAFGRHPLAGLAAAFAGVSGGFGSNFLLGSIDPVLAGLSESAAQMVVPGMRINPAVNYYFLVVSALLVIVVATLVTDRIVEPRLGTYRGAGLELEDLSPVQRKALRWAGGAFLVVLLAFLVAVVPENGLLRGKGSVLHGPFFKGLITAIFLVFFLPGLVYGLVAGTIRSDRELVGHVVEAVKGLAPYIVLVFCAAQFVFFFKKSNLGIILAIHGAELIRQSGLSGPALIVLFVLFSAAMNMFMGSASAKWAIMAPVFVPMFLLSGYHPALTQAAFRIGDSVTNVITPMMSYFALILTFVEKYDDEAGIGTLVATMLPYSIALLLAWTALLVLWYVLGLPLGPGGPLFA